MKIQNSNIAWLLCGLTLVLAAYAMFLHLNTSRTIASEIDVINADAVRIATILDRGGLTAEAAQVISDCDQSERLEFDRLLSSLNTLSSAELDRLEVLFGACGSFFADARSMVTFELAQKVQQLSTLMQLPHNDTVIDGAEGGMDTWNDLVRLEKERAQLAKELVGVQRTIISSLQAGAAAESETIVMQLNEANEIQQSLALIGNQIDSLRARLDS